MEADYWRYDINGLITTLDSNYSINSVRRDRARPRSAISSLAMAPAPAPTPGLILRIHQSVLQLGIADDERLGYRAEVSVQVTPSGIFNAEIDWTHTNNYTNNPAPGAAVQEIAGTYSKQFGNYTKNRALRILGLELAGERRPDHRALHRVLDSHNPSVTGVNANGKPYPPICNRLGCCTRISPSAIRSPTKTHLQFGVRNISDKQPPIFFQNNVTNANTDVETYDMLGRQWFVGFTAEVLIDELITRRAARAIVRPFYCGT